MAAAKALADQLEDAAGVRATHDPARAATSRPCVLIGPPSIDYKTLTNEWPVALLSSKPIGSLAAVAELDVLLQAVLPVLDVEDATPVSYALTPEVGAVPAYLCRVTT